MQDEALMIVENQSIDESQFAIVLFDESWHEGVVGIVAGKLKETYQCPSAVFAKADDVLKGSIRSIPDVHIKDLLDLVDRDNPELIEKFGGHAMAAGLTIKPQNFEMFKDAEAGDKEINIERTEQAVETKPDIIAAGCPFCNTMMTDGVKNKVDGKIEVKDIAELIVKAKDL